MRVLRFAATYGYFGRGFAYAKADHCSKTFCNANRYGYACTYIHTHWRSHFHANPCPHPYDVG